ncbi:tRNA-splicing endonuclease subunit Sen15 [Menidia menidia]
MKMSEQTEASEKLHSGNWMLDHPVYKQMKDMEVADSAQLHAAFLVYMDLSEVRRWKEVSCLKSPELQVVLLEAREKEETPAHTVLPLPLHEQLSHSSIRLLLDRGFPLLLCAVASDSTLVYQRLTDGLVTPEPPAGPFQDVDHRQRRKRRMQR